MNIKEIERRFSDHPGGAALRSLCYDIREEYITLAKLVSTLSKCRESNIAIAKLEESLYWALAAIIRPPTEVSADRNDSYGGTD